MPTLPAELWIMIFDFLITEGIVRLDQCDHLIFPYDYVFLSPGEYRYRFYGSYHRLRLVCRSFNTLLGTGPYCTLRTSTFPLSANIRALRVTAFDGSHEPLFQQLVADPSRCERLVCLDVSCSVYPNTSRPNVFDILNAGEGGALPNVQSLTFWFFSKKLQGRYLLFWNRLCRGFPRLVTLSVEVDQGYLCLAGETDNFATMERLEILYFGRGIQYSKCHFPSLRYASVNSLMGPFGLEIFQLSPYLDCILIQVYSDEVGVDVRSFSRLPATSLWEDRFEEVLPDDRNSPKARLRLYSVNKFGIPRSVNEILELLPITRRITTSNSPSNSDGPAKRTRTFKRVQPG